MNLILKFLKTLLGVIIWSKKMFIDPKDVFAKFHRFILHIQSNLHSNNHFYETTTHLWWPILSPSKPISTQSLLYKMTTFLKQDLASGIHCICAYMPTCIGVCMILHMPTLTHVLIFSLQLFIVFKIFPVLLILYCLKIYHHIFDL